VPPPLHFQTTDSASLQSHCNDARLLVPEEPAAEVRYPRSDASRLLKGDGANSRTKDMQVLDIWEERE
jgi:hypothetical protein